ncbi:integral membrane protein [Fusarium mexicanum]|uniref:Integral membrane protein n=1 Tax=Fusarium mexicanum TaxID=751941 RepID=A0A8H5JB49_9HYPO|nr:integral membrane protein [Fusarium mexicanum]
MATSEYASESRGAVAIAVMATLSSISLIVVSLRVYARAIMLRNFGVDDACAILACLLTIADATIIATNVRNGLGSHISTLSGEQISNFLRIFYFSTVVYNLALAVIKTIFLLQYYRAIPVRQYKKTYIASVVLVTCWSLSQIFLNMFMCTPIPSFWDVTIKGTCILNKSSFYVGAAGNILTDILIMVLPIPVLRSLKLGRRQKWILISVFCLGIFTCFISLVRIKFLNIGTDITWHNVESASWSVSELCCGIICACVPTLRPLLSGHDRGSSHNQSSYARHENSRTNVTARQTGTSRSHEMHDLPRTLHSSESKDQLRPLESTIVVRTDVDQKRSRPQPGHGLGAHQVVISQPNPTIMAAACVKYKSHQGYKPKRSHHSFRPPNTALNITIMSLYYPLTSDEKHSEIRICVLLPKSCGTMVSCKLETLNLLEDKTDYEALSYAWGSSENKATIRVNETTLQVAQNLKDALTYLRHDSKPRSLWIDAICINQSDVDERNSQVRLMGCIYSSASCVVSWLGLEDDPIDYVEQMRKARSLIELVRPCSTDDLFALLSDSPSKGDLEEVFEDGLYSLQLVIGERKYRPPYWRRAWIIQEVSLARVWKLQSGALCISERDIQAVMEILQDPRIKTLMKKKYQARRLRALISLNSFVSVSVYRGILSSSDASELAITSPNWETSALRTPRTQGSWHLLSLLRHSWLRLCADPRDKVFSILAASDMKDSHFERLKIDYTKSISRVYTDSVKAIIETSSSLDVLSYVSAADRTRSLDLPSWVPNWETYKTPVIADRPISYDRQRAMGNTVARVSFQQCSGKEILLASGICFGTVVGLRDPLINVDAERMGDKARTANLEYLSLYRQLPSVFNQLSASALPNRLSGASFRRTCSLGLLGHKLDDSFGELLDELSLESSDNEDAPVSNVEDLIKRFGYRYRTMASALVNRSIFLVEPTNLGKTQLSYEIGIGEAAAVQKSDLVCLLEGCGTPLILRPMGSQHVVVCAAYVDSLMTGLGLSYMKEGLFEAQRFQLI